MSRFSLRTCAIFILALGVFAGCSGGSSGSQVTIQGTEFKYDPATVTVKAGTAAQIVLRNAGTQPHDFTVDSLDGKKVQGVAQTGQSTTISFTPTQAGTYQFYCSQPGHKEGGMVGQLVVQ